jgi:hypothetical protein
MTKHIERRFSNVCFWPQAAGQIRASVTAGFGFGSEKNETFSRNPTDYQVVSEV